MGKYKRTFKFIFILLISFLFIPKADAYVRISSTGGYIDPTEKNIIDGQSDWSMTGNQGPTSNSSPWLYSAGQFWYAGGLSGDYLTVNADYYVGIKTEPYSDALVENYLYSSQNTLTISNLRCGIGDFGRGYDNSFLPEITNFKVEGTNYYPDSGGTQYLLHITYNYKQRISSVVNTSSNMSCWFERNPSNGLFAQPVWYTNVQSIRYYYFNNNFQYAVSTDPNTAILNDINSSLNNQISQNNQIINNGYGIMNKQQEIIDSQKETNSTLKDNDSSEATNEAGSFFSGFETDTFGLTSIVTAPLNLIESITSSTCVPMGLPIPFIEGQTLNLPCLRGIYEDNFGTFYDIYKTITFGIVAYYVCVKLFNLVKDFKNPEHDEIEVLEL